MIESFKELFVRFGAGWVLWLLFALAAIGLAVAIERWLYFRKKKEDLRALVSELDAHLASNAFERALETLAPMRSMAAGIARAGLRLAPRGAAAAEKGMESAISAERGQLESRLSFLGTLGNNAPFIGLFGTVIGVILAFDQLGQAGAATQAGAARVMAAIAEALVATAIGIAVALPAVAANNYFHRQVAAMLDDSETLSKLVLAYLVERKE